VKLYTYELVDFDTRDSNEGLSFHKDTFISFINSPNFVESMKRLILIGGNSHGCRDGYQEYRERNFCSIGTMADYLIENELASNVLTKIWIENNKCIGTLMSLPTNKGKYFDSLSDVGIDIKVSMSVQVHQDRRYYYITDLYGVDFTTGPAFNTKKLKVEEVKNG